MDIHSSSVLKFLRFVFRSLLTLAGILTTGVPAKSQDVILFNNGDRLSGKLVEAAHDGVTFAGTATGTVSLPWNTIQRINLNQSSLAVTSKLNSTSSEPNQFTAKLDAIEVHANNLALIQSGAGPALTVPIVDFISISPPSPSSTPPASIVKGWRGSLQLQDSLTGATQKKYDLAGSLHVGRSTKSRDAFRHQVTSINLQEDFGEASKPNASPVRTALYEGILEHEVYLNDKGSAYLFGLGDFYHNLSLGMNFQQSYGLGVGWNGQYKRHRFGFVGDVRYVSEDLYAPGTSLKLAASGLSEYYSYTFSWPKKKPISFDERLLFVPSFNQSKAYQARGTAGLRLPLTPKFSIGIREYDDYLRNSPKGTNQNYSKVSLTLNYSIGAPL
jgi:hypothetical protein